MMIYQTMETSDDWISERTGIKNRRWVGDKKLTTSLMGTYAAEKAIADAGIDKNDIDFIIFSTLSPDYYFQAQVFFYNEILASRKLVL